MSPSVTSTTCPMASRRARSPGRSASRIPSRISVPPLASSVRIHSDALRLAAASAKSISRWKRRGDDENSIISKRSRSESESIIASATRLACAIGAPPIDPLVSSRSVRSRATGVNAAFFRGGTIVTRACASSRRRPTSTVAAACSTATGQRTTTSRSSGTAFPEPSSTRNAPPSAMHDSGCDGDSIHAAAPRTSGHVPFGLSAAAAPRTSGEDPVTTASRTLIVSDARAEGAAATSNDTFPPSPTRPAAPK